MENLSDTYHDPSYRFPKIIIGRLIPPLKKNRGVITIRQPTLTNFDVTHIPDWFPWNWQQHPLLSSYTNDSWKIAKLGIPESRSCLLFQDVSSYFGLVAHFRVTLYHFAIFMHKKGTSSSGATCSAKVPKISVALWKVPKTSQNNGH